MFGEIQLIKPEVAKNGKTIPVTFSIQKHILYQNLKKKMLGRIKPIVLLPHNLLKFYLMLFSYLISILAASDIYQVYLSRRKKG